MLGLSVRLCCQGWCLFLGCLLPGLSVSGCAYACPTHEQLPVHSPCASLWAERCWGSARTQQCRQGAGGQEGLW